jgi:hypothetical protein
VTAAAVKAPAKTETFYRLRRDPGVLMLYVIEEVQVVDNVVTERKMIGTRDSRNILMDKISRLLEAEYK